LRVVASWGVPDANMVALDKAYREELEDEVT
jgi:hypothetical protein